MQRTLGDDLKVAAAGLAGVALACLLGIGPWTALVPAAIGIALVTGVIVLVRTMRSRRAS